ncbi:hypothetical protein ACE6H2_009262 [Prunus campanulata]
MRPQNLNCVSIVLIAALLCQSVHSQLKVGFYTTSCTLAELIVKDEVRKGFFKNPGVAAGLVRLHFHDCFVRGCDASVLIDSTSSNEAEKDSPANNPSLRGFEVIDSAKARLEANIKAGPKLRPPVRCSVEAAMPQGNTSPNLVVPMNPASPAVTDTSYYTYILTNRGLFTSDQTLLTNSATANQVNQNAKMPFLWRTKFASAMVKMGKLEVLTGNAGEIRANCRVINS